MECTEKLILNEYKNYLRTHKSGKNATFYGKTHTNEAKEKMRQSRLGKNSHKILLKNLNLDFLELLIQDQN
jgi:hypothetical protein